MPLIYFVFFSLVTKNQILNTRYQLKFVFLLFSVSVAFMLYLFCYVLRVKSFVRHGGGGGRGDAF